MSDADYQLLKIFLDRHFEWYAPKYPTTTGLRPSRFLEGIEKTSMSNAKKGLQMALNDIVEESAGWRPDQVADADTKFADVGTFTLSEIRRLYSKKYLQMLKRGVISSDAEYYLMRGIVDGSGIEPSATEAAQLQGMIDDYEIRQPDSRLSRT